MKYKIYPTTNDVVFKRIFGDIKNKRVIKGFLSSVLNIPKEEYDIMKIGNPFFNISDDVNDKVGILDVKIITKNSKIVDIEMQVAKTKYMGERILYYLSKMILEQIGLGENYGKIQKVISIVIASEHILIKENNRQHNRYLLRSDNADSVLTDKMEVDILDLMKPEDTSEHDSKIQKWVDFFNANTEEKLEKIIDTSDPEIQEAAKIVLELNQDEDVRIQAQQRENVLRDYRSELEGAKEDGMKQGMEKGKHDQKIEIAKNMILDKEPIDKIKRYTGLTVEEIEKLR